MKQVVLALLFSVVTSLGVAQDYKKKIESEFTAYITAIVNQDFNKAMGYVIPEFFEILPKDQMVQLLEQTFNNPQVEFQLKSPEILSIADSEEIEGRHYALLTYTNQMNMKFHNGEETAEEKATRIKLTKTAFEQNFGAENVSFNEETGFFEVQVKKDVYAISADGKTQWKFLVVEEKQKPILERLLPKKLIDRI